MIEDTINLIKARDAEVAAYLQHMLDEEMPITEHTLKTYGYTLIKFKEHSGCSNLIEFGDDAKALKYWRAFKKSIRESDLALSYANTFIAAFKSYCKNNRIKLIPEITYLNKNSVSEDAIQKHIVWERSMEEKVQAFNNKDNEIKKIFGANITQLAVNRGIREKARFAVIEFLYTGKRISEIVASKISDEHEIVDGGKTYKALWVYSEKTKENFEKIIIEDIYWKARGEYIKLLRADGYDGDEMFPGLSTARLSQLIAGYNEIRYKERPDGLKEKIVRRHAGLAELVWGERVWTHIFRHSKITSLAGEMPLEALQEWAGHRAIKTTASYVGKSKKKEMILKALKNKSKDGWS